MQILLILIDDDSLLKECGVNSGDLIIVEELKDSGGRPPQTQNSGLRLCARSLNACTCILRQVIAVADSALLDLIFRGSQE